MCLPVTIPLEENKGVLYGALQMPGKGTDLAMELAATRYPRAAGLCQGPAGSAALQNPLLLSQHPQSPELLFGLGQRMFMEDLQ